MKNKPTTKLTQGISFPNRKLLLAAQQRAKDECRSLSSYINHLVSRDLGCELSATETQPTTQPTTDK